MAYYLVQADLIVSAVDFDPSVLMDHPTMIKRLWHVGDLTRPNGRTKFKTSGIRFALLDEIEEPDWLDQVTRSLKEWAEKFESKLNLIPPPLVSVYIRTGGSAFPPIFFARDFLSIVERIHAEVDVDIVATASLERHEDEADET